ncbi:MAG: hypothetical protein ORN54_08965 [Cyclobacteriaceae bacterium]|nr:hypothetical protein [Cyclobacteriaceae bacterium]
MLLEGLIKWDRDRNITTHFFLPFHFVFLWAILTGADVASAQNEPVKQDTSRRVDIYRRDKTKITGWVISLDKTRTVLVTEKSDTIQIPQSDLLALVPFNEKLTITYKNLFAYKYFISSSSIPLEKRVWHYSNQGLFFNSVHYGVNKNLTAGLSVGTFIQFYAAPKIKYCLNPENKYKIALNAQYTHVLDWTSNERSTYTFAFAQVLITKGNEENNITVGLGEPIKNDWVSIDYFATLAFTKKISKRSSFISDNSLMKSSTSSAMAYLFSAGVRINRKNHAFDLGVFTPPLAFNFSNVIIPIPFLSYSLKLNNH